MKRRFFLVVFVLGLALGGWAEAASFSDIDGHWAKDYIEWSAVNNIFTGYEDGTFKPDDKITRGEFIQLISNLLGLKYRVSSLNFKDVSQDIWYRPAVENLVGLKLLKNEEYLEPLQKIKRDEAFGLLGQLLPYRITERKLTFADNYKINRYRDIGVLVDLGVIIGGENNCINSDNEITRAETATIFYKFLNSGVPINTADLERAASNGDFNFDFLEEFRRSIYGIKYKSNIVNRLEQDPQIDRAIEIIRNMGKEYVYYADSTENIEHTSYEVLDAIRDRIESVGLGNINVSIDGNLIRYTFEYDIDKETMDKYYNLFTFIDQETKFMSDYDKAKYIHDWIVKNTSYDYDFYKSNQKSVAERNPYSSSSVFLYGKAVCQGYARAFQSLASVTGLNSIIISGETYSGSRWGGHAWNLVEIDGKLYHIDTTWDDPVATDGRELLRYKYFLIDDRTIGEDHRWDESKYPRANNGCLNQGLDLTGWDNERNDSYYRSYR